MENSIKTKEYNQGQKLTISGGEYRIIISGKETDGAYAIIEMSVPIGAGPMPHSHPDFEEVFYVLEGELSFRSETGSFLANKGATVAIPKGGIIHNFKNLSDKPAKILCTVIPAGLDVYFAEVAELINSNKDKEVEVKEAISVISEKFGLKLFNPDYWNL